MSGHSYAAIKLDPREVKAIQEIGRRFTNPGVDIASCLGTIKRGDVRKKVLEKIRRVKDRCK